MGHLAKIELVASRWQKGEFTDWFPFWYNGSSAVEFYPPLSVWIPAVLQIVLRDIRLTFKVLIWFCLFLGGVAAGRVVNRFQGGPVAAAITGVLYSCSTYTIHTVLGAGTIGRALSLPLFPLLLGAVLDLVDDPDRMKWLRVVVLVSIQVLVHVMHAYFLFIVIGLIALIWVITHKNYRLKRFIIVLSACLFGMLITSFWTIPAYLWTSIPGVPAANPGASSSLALSIKEAFSSRYAGHSVLLGFAIVGAVFTCWRRPCVGWPLTISSLVCFVFMTGPETSIYHLLPLSQSLQPGRFLNAAYLPCSILGGLLVEACCTSNHVIPKVSMFRVATVVILVCIGVLAETDYRNPYNAGSNYGEIVSFMESIGYHHGFDTGRVSTEFYIANAEKAYFPAKYGLNSSDGWNLEGTPHVYMMRNQNECYGKGFDDYILSNWDTWNVRYALITDPPSSMLGSLAVKGWIKTMSSGTTSLFASPKPSMYLQCLSTDVLVVGRSSYFVRRFMPGVSEGFDPNPLTYTDEYLKQFHTIYLYDLPVIDSRVLEQRIIEWCKQGKRVVIDLSASQISSVFGVTSAQIPVSSKIVLLDTASSGARSLLLETDPGSGAVYKGLDQEIIKCEVEGKSVAVAGIKKLQYGDIYFTGLHLPRLAKESAKDAMIGLLERLLGRSRSVQQAGGQVGDGSLAWTSSGTSFSYSLEQEASILVSITYTPKWRATLDGLRIPVMSHHNLVLLRVPSGNHHVELEYGSSVQDIAGSVVSLAALVAILFLVLAPQTRDHFKVSG